MGTEEKLTQANTKLDKAGTAADDSELEKAEERADTGETKILELEEELRVVANNLKSLEVAEEKANQREKSYKEQIKARAGLPRSQSRSCRRRLTDSRMSWSLNRRSTRPSLRSLSRPSLRCLDTKLLSLHTLINFCFVELCDIVV